MNTDRFGLIEWAPDVWVHPSAYIDEGVEIGRGTKVWHYCHLIAGCRVGENCSFGQNVMVGANVVLGNNARIQNNVSLYPGVHAEDDVFCGPSVVFTNVKNPRSAHPRKNQLSSTLLKKGATIGANATIVCGTIIGQHCFVGAGAVVTHDIPDHALVVGTPARTVGWMSEAGHRLDDELVCPETGVRYVKDGSGLSPLPTDGSR